VQSAHVDVFVNAVALKSWLLAAKCFTDGSPSRMQPWMYATACARQVGSSP